MKKKSSGFSGSLGFVLAAAGSAVGVGNIWRFPYLCAKDGGGLFLVVYLVLVLTFGFVLLTTDVAIGRRTKLNALNAYAALRKNWRFLGFLTFLVPALIMTYYSVIGGWILKYLTAYLTTDGAAAAQDGYFTGFITAPVAPIVFTLVFSPSWSTAAWRRASSAIPASSCPACCCSSWASPFSPSPCPIRGRTASPAPACRVWGSIFCPIWRG